MTAPRQQTGSGHAFDDYVAAIKRRVNVAVPIILSAITVAGSLALLLPDEYRSIARISVNLEGASSIEPVSVAAYADQYISELSDRVLSRENLNQLARDTAAFAESEDELPLSDRVAILREGYYLGIDTQSVMNDKGREVEIISGFRTGFKGPDPTFAQTAAKFFSASFLAEDRRRRTERAGSASNFLSKQIAGTEAQIVESEKRIAAFKVENACCLPELQNLNLSTIQRAERDIENIQPRIRTLEQDRIFLQTQLDEIGLGSASTDRLDELEQEYRRLVANYGPEHPDVGRVRREIEALTGAGSMGSGDDELSRLRIELAEAELNYSDLHPDVRSLRQRITTLENAQNQQAGSGRNPLSQNPRYRQLRSSINAIDTELAELRRRAPNLRARIREYEVRLARTPQIESEYQALNRKLDIARENFDNLQQQLVVARQTEALESAEIGARLTEIRSASLPNTPYGPQRLGIVLVGAFLAFGLGIGSILLAEMLDTSIRGSSDVVRVTQIVPIAKIPLIQNSVVTKAARRKRTRQLSLVLAIIIAITGILYWNLA